MAKVGVIICARYGACAGGKCFRALRERSGGFARYPAWEEVEIVGYASCGGCPGGNVEYAPLEFIKNGCDTVHLATGMVVGYPPCPHLQAFVELIPAHFKLAVVVGTHPIPLKYFEAHARLGFWEASGMASLAEGLLREDKQTMQRYD